MTRRSTRTSDLSAGCFVCHGYEARWTGANAQALAARHHDATRHPTWCDIFFAVRYGTSVADPRQVDLEDAIASASSGDVPEAVPLTELDAPAVPAADVSAPHGRSSNPALAAAKPEHTHA